MINGKRVLAVVPARGGSKGLKRKNVKELAGHPLVSYPIRTALTCKYVDRVIVSTEDAEIKVVAEDYGAPVPFLRPAELAVDTASTFSVLDHVLTELSQRGETYEYLVLLEPTSPLTESKDVEAALERLDSSRDLADAMVGICRMESQHPAFAATLASDGRIKPYLEGGFERLGRRQDLTELYFFEGSVYVSDTVALRRNRGFYHERTLGLVMPKWKAFEVDDLVDWICIEAILQHRDDLNSRSIS